jgi:hypothetical protein
MVILKRSRRAVRHRINKRLRTTSEYGEVHYGARKLSCRGERFHATGKTSAEGAAVAIGSRGHFAVRVEGSKVVDVWACLAPSPSMTGGTLRS